MILIISWQCAGGVAVVLGLAAATRQGLQQIRIIFVFVFGNKPNSGIRILFVFAAIFETNNIRICSICCCHEILLFAVFVNYLNGIFVILGPFGAIWGK